MYKKNSLALCIALVITGSGQALAQTNSTAPLATAAPTTTTATATKTAAAPATDIQEVVISGVREAELNARESERKKNIFSSVISQDDAGNFADQNVAESLQRLPGVSLQVTNGEGQYVAIRGLGPGFVNVSMNGSEMASGNSDDRSVSLDSLPADMLGAIEVFKTLTPDLDLNSIGGEVNVKTVSAFDKKHDTLKMSLQDTYQSYAAANSPKVTLQGTNLFVDDTIGVAYTLTYEKNTSEGYQVYHHQTTDLRPLTVDVTGAAPSDTMLTPYQFWNEQDDSTRTRKTGELDIGWRPTDSSEYHLHLNKTSYKDADTSLREYYRFDGAGTGDIAYIDPTTNVFGVVDAQLQQQYFIQDGTTSTSNIDFNGKNNFDDGWTLDYKIAHSDGHWSKPNGRRAQFRIQHLPMLGEGSEDFIAAQIISPAAMAQLAGVPSINSSATGGYFTMVDGRDQTKMDYDNLFIEDSFRDDNLNQFSANLKKEFDDGGSINYIKVGVLAKNRNRSRNRNRWSVNPEGYSGFCDGDAQCKDWAENGQLGDFQTFTPNDPDFNYDVITRSDAEKLIASTWNTAKLVDVNETGLSSTKDDYHLTETSKEVYAMAEFQTSENSSLIAGMRYVVTQFKSTGYLSMLNDRFQDFSDQNLDIALPLAGTDKQYANLFPSIHFRYEPSDTTLMRAAIWTSYTRPSFDQARAYATIADRVALCNPNLLDTNNAVVCSDDLAGTLGASSPADVQNFYMSNNTTLNLGNPKLNPMKSTNVDYSFAWYPSNDLFLQAAFFYKDISDFIVNINGQSMALADLPIQLPVDQVTQFHIPSDLVFDSVNYTINGQKASVFGTELSYSQNFKSGFFVQSNLTLIHSSADVGSTIRASKIQLPDQADTTANLVLGWEKGKYSFRVIGNYRGTMLKQVGSCPDVNASNCKEWADIYEAPSRTIDVKATYQITDDIKIYFDALNLNDDRDLYYYSGNAMSGGRVLWSSSDFGKKFDMGINVKFY